MRKILCATNETEVSRKAEIFAAELAKALGGELAYVYVTPIDPKELETTMAWEPVILEELEAREHEVHQHGCRVASQHGVANARCVVIRSRDTAGAVVRYAEQEGFDHIVTGSTGRTGIPRFVLGSVSSEIIHKAHCPVTVVR